MATSPAIPESEHKDVMKWWSECHSTRQISELLKLREVDASHGAVWRLIQRIVVSSGDMEVAAALSEMRIECPGDVESLMSIESRTLNAARPGPEDGDFGVMLKKTKLLAYVHRLRCNRLKAAGVFGKLGNTIHRDFAHVWSGSADEGDRIKEEAAQAEHEGDDVTAESNSQLLRVTASKPRETEEISHNSGAIVTGHPGEDSPAPARTRPCPCGSGRKYKRFCAKSAPAGESRA